ncbi:MAG: YrbL family protein [Pseudomonadales bacterium]|nr:YrbL family protein [Pseudomonadales bacterium]
MKVPKRIQPLVDDGIIDEVMSRLMSGKEADVFIVRCGTEMRCAKVYKEAMKRSFKKAAEYTEGRKVRSGRRARAMDKGSRYGRKQQEEIWQNAEVSALYSLAEAGVRVPKAYGCIDGVLLMELITDEKGDVAPRLDEVVMPAEQAREDHALMMRFIVRMLCVGIIHGDLSEFNVLVDADGPVVIDLPQAVNAAANNQAKGMLARDVNNMSRYYGQYAPELLGAHYADEIWAHYEEGDLTPEIALTGQFEASGQSADVDAVLEEIKAAMAEEQARQERINGADE